jgi:predicted permease
MRTGWHRLWARVRAVFAPPTLDRDLEQELDVHVSASIDDYVRRGLPPEEARRRARLALGGRAWLRGAHRDVRGLPWIETTMQDVRSAVRTMRRQRAFALFATAIVALGIGGSATVFSVIDVLLLRPLPFADPTALVWITNSGGGEGLSARTMPVDHFLALRDENTSFVDVASYYAHYTPGSLAVTGDGEPERINSIPVSDNFFSLLGVRPELGRLFTPQEGRYAGPPPAVILTHAFWERHFDADPNVVGRTLTLNAVPIAIAGVLPESFDFAAAFAPGLRVDLYYPYPLTAASTREGNTLIAIGRLRPGVTLERARAEAAALGPSIQRRDPARAFGLGLVSLAERVNGQVRPALIVLAWAIAGVVLMACANLSSLLIARSSARQRELAVRAALGAGRRRLARQMLTESLVLASCGGCLGLAVAVAGTRVLARADGLGIPLLGRVRVDSAVLLFIVSLVVLTGLVIGLAPAFHAQGRAIQTALKDGERGSTGGRTHAALRQTLVATEIALATMLLVATGLLTRSLVKVLDVDLGFQPRHAIVTRVDSPRSRGGSLDARNAYFDQARARIRAVCGIEAAGVTDVLAVGRNRSWSAGARGQVYSLQHPPPDAFVRIVTEGYLSAMGIPLRAGRDFTAADRADATPVILVNETLARTLWPGGNPIGKGTLYAGGERQVVGVVADVRHLALERAAGNEIYLPMRQTTDYASVELVARTTRPSEGFGASLLATLRPIDPFVPAADVMTMQSIVDGATAPRRTVVTVLVGFSIFAVLLAALGVYAVIAYTVSQRSQEFGIRMALGASAAVLQRRVVAATLSLTTVGLGVGLGAAWLFSGLLRDLLFDVAVRDAATFGGIAAIVGGVALVAAGIPARRIARIDPVSALRAE